MRFAAKIWLVLIAAGVLPVALLGLVSFTVSRDELQRTVGRMQEQAAEDVALFTERFVSGAFESLKLSSSTLMPLHDYSQKELAQVIGLPFAQLSFLSILAIVDDANVPFAGPMFVPDGVARAQVARELQDRMRVSDEDLDTFAHHLPAPPARIGDLVASEPYPGRSGPPRIAASLRLESNRLLVAEIVLGDVAARLADLSSMSGVAYLVDVQGNVISHGRTGAEVTEDEQRLWEIGFPRNGSWSALVRRADGERWLAAFAPVRHFKWGAVVAQPMHVAFSAADKLRFYTAGWSFVALVAALAVGWLLATRVTRPVQRLSRAAAEIAAGDYQTPVEVRGKDEIADLGRAFAHMAGEVRRRDEEIRGWNKELQRRVEDRTAELKRAQDQILRTRRLAALGSLGAGLAHELNNPMTAITGYLAILKKQLGDGTPQTDMIARAQEQANRVTRVIEDLRSFADQERVSHGQRFSLVHPVRAALDLYDERLRAAGIDVKTHLDETVPEVQGDPVQIQQVVAHLVENAINAMPQGGTLDVSLRSVDGDALRLRIADTGKGIPSTIRERIFDPFFTTKEQAGRVGLGLSVSHSIVEAHHGQIVVESEEGVGAAISVLLPAATAAHLV
jgi:two-component system, NtrC family, sensor kinase